MADLRYVQPNRLRREVNMYHRRLLTMAAPILAVMAWIHPFVVVFGVAGVAALWSLQNRRLHGAVGEDRALGVPRALPGSLATLPAEYVVFNQVIVPNGKSCRELDFVVVGPRGIFAIEVKHHRGTISGRETDLSWRQRKRSRAGNYYEQELRNPVGQIKGAIHVLKRYLRDQGINLWIEGIVVFTHPECTLSLGEMPMPVLRLEKLAPWILDHRSARPPIQAEAMIKAIQRLREGRRSPPSPKHISYFMRDFVTPRERVEGIMNYDLKAAMKRQARENPPIPSPAPVPVPTPRPHRRQRPVLAVIENHHAIPTPARGVRRKFTVIKKHTESETVFMEDDWFV